MPKNTGHGSVWSYRGHASAGVFTEQKKRGGDFSMGKKDIELYGSTAMNAVRGKSIVGRYTAPTTVSGQVGKSFLTTGAALTAYWGIMALLPFVGAGFPLLLPLILMGIGALAVE